MKFYPNAGFATFKIRMNSQPIELWLAALALA